MGCGCSLLIVLPVAALLGFCLVPESVQGPIVGTAFRLYSTLTVVEMGTAFDVNEATVRTFRRAASTVLLDAPSKEDRFGGHETVRGAIVATWCGYSQNFLGNVQSDSALRAEFPLVFVLDDEMDAALQREHSNGGLDDAEFKAAKETTAAYSILLANPDFLDQVPDIELRFVNASDLGLDSGELGYPFFFECKRGHCVQIYHAPWVGVP